MICHEFSRNSIKPFLFMNILQYALLTWSRMEVDWCGLGSRSCSHSHWSDAFQAVSTERLVKLRALALISGAPVERKCKSLANFLESLFFFPTWFRVPVSHHLIVSCALFAHFCPPSSPCEVLDLLPPDEALKRWQAGENVNGLDVRVEIFF